MNAKKLMIAVVATLAITAFVPALSAQENNGYLNAGREMKMVNGAEQTAKVFESVCKCIGNACRCVKDAFSSSTKNLPAGYVPGREGAVMRTADALLQKKQASLDSALVKANLAAAKKAKEQAAKVCARCGEPITHQTQHCPATSYTSLCATAEKLEAIKKAEQQAQQAEASLPKCIHCHKPIHHNEQECSAKNYNDLCEAPKPVAATPKAEVKPAQGTEAKPAQEPEAKPTQKAEDKPAAVAKMKVCAECGRTEEEVAKYGHNHKGPYIFVNL